MDLLITAVDQLKSGESVKVGDLRLEMEKDIFRVIGWSEFYDLTNLSQLIALRELNEIKQLFSGMMISSLELQRFVSTKIIQYNLYYDDGGKASVGICSEKDNILKWYVTLAQE